MLATAALKRWGTLQQAADQTVAQFTVSARACSAQTPRARLLAVSRPKQRNWPPAQPAWPSHAGQPPLMQNQVQQREPLSTRADAADSLAGSGQAFKLILYSRDGCHLCDGLKEKVDALFARATYTTSVLSDAHFEVRDIATNAHWEALYGLKIPVLATAELDNSREAVIPRAAPRVTVDRLEKHIAGVVAARRAAQN